MALHAALADSTVLTREQRGVRAEVVGVAVGAGGGEFKGLRRFFNNLDFSACMSAAQVVRLLVRVDKRPRLVVCSAETREEGRREVLAREVCREENVLRA